MHSVGVVELLFALEPGRKRPPEVGMFRSKDYIQGQDGEPAVVVAVGPEGARLREY